MAREVLNGLDVGFQELRGLRIENLSEPPENADNGFIYFDTTDGAFRLYQNGSWYELATADGSGGGGSSIRRDTSTVLASENPVLAAGDAAMTTDTHELGIGDGTTAWSDLLKFEPRGDRELAYASSTVAQSGITDAIVNLTGLEINFEVTSRPVVVSLFLPWLTATNTGSVVGLYFLDGSGSTIVQANSGHMGAVLVGQGYLEHRISTPGQYTVRAGINRMGGGSVGNNADLGTLVSTLRAIEL